MSWHQVPNDGAWKACTVAKTAALGQRLWLRCNACGHDLFVDGLPWCQERGISPETPMLLIGHRLKCSCCGEKKAHCWSEPFGMHEGRVTG